MTQTLQLIRSLGVQITLDGDKLLIGPKRLINSGIRHLVLTNRDQLIYELRLESTASRILDLSEADFRQYQEEIEAAPADDPDAEFDRQALAIAESILRDAA